MDKIFIISCCHNASNWISRSIRSIKKQSFHNLEYLLHLDNCSDDTYSVASKLAQNDNRINLYNSHKRIYAGRARWELLKKITYARDSDIVILLDGDDWLYSADSLQQIANFYKENQVVVTHGNFISSNGKICHWSRDYDLKTKERNEYRTAPWNATHLRTFKYGLFRELREDILRCENGLFFEAATDMALFLPILELSGVYSSYVESVLCVYNERGKSVYDCERLIQQKNAEEQIRNKKKYSPLPIHKLSNLFSE